MYGTVSSDLHIGKCQDAWIENKNKFKSLPESIKLSSLIMLLFG